MMNNIKIVE